MLPFSLSIWIKLPPRTKNRNHMKTEAGGNPISGRIWPAAGKPWQRTNVEAAMEQLKNALQKI